MLEMSAWHQCSATRTITALSFLLIVSGCTKPNHFEYTPFVRELDGLSQLGISTYPAGYPTRLSDKGDLYEEYESAEALYLQVHIRDKSKTIGPNPHVQSINIHSFSYRSGKGPPVALLSDNQDSFWMQGNPRYEKRHLPPVPYVPDANVYIEISFTLNGESYVFEGDMPASERSGYWPTFIVKQGI